MAYFSDRPCEIDKATALAYLKEGSALEIGELADKVRRKLHSNRAYYAVNAAITYSNICEVLCPICSFSKKEGQEGANIDTMIHAYVDKCLLIDSPAEEPRASE